MSKHVDALILIGYASRTTADVLPYVHEDTEQGLWYINKGKKLWYDGATIYQSLHWILSCARSDVAIIPHNDL